MELVGKQAYDLHHLLDPINIAVCSKVLKMGCFEESRKRFDWDFINDIGIINLLRKEYVEKGNIAAVFNLYQSSRIDAYSHRYESLLATLLLAIVGNVVSGIVLAAYSAGKDTVVEKVGRKNGLFGKEIESKDAEKIMQKVAKGQLTKKAIHDYFAERSEIMAKDFRKLTKCYVAREMVDDDVITRKEYDLLVRYFLKGREGKRLPSILAKFRAFEQKYNISQNAINPDRIMLAIDGYSKGIVDLAIGEGADPILTPEDKLAEYLYGLPAANGFGQGKLRIGGVRNLGKVGKYVLLIDAKKYSAEDVSLIRESQGVIAFGGGMTGHVALACRGLGKGCVILEKKDALKLKTGSKVVVSGEQGIVAIGNFII
jgi:phosphohistidine swiveling domain-containing protein